MVSVSSTKQYIPRHSIAYGEVPLCSLASGQSFANLVRELMFPSPQPRDWAILDSLFLELDGHCYELVAGIEGLITGYLR